MFSIMSKHSDTATPNFGFATAMPVERGCGKRKPGGLYLECGLGANGLPLEHFLIDPPRPLPTDIGEGIINKPKLWQDPNTQTNHVLIWVGQSHYPYVGDFIEEVRQFGASRRIPHTFPFDKLTPHSTMIFVHPRTLNTRWAVQSLPTYCPKEIYGHQHPAQLVASDLPANISSTSITSDNIDQDSTIQAAPDQTKVEKVFDDWGQSVISLIHAVPKKRCELPATGPCLGKTYNLIPLEAAIEVLWRGVDPTTGKALSPLCVRQLPSLSYTYEPHLDETWTTAALEIKQGQGSLNPLSLCGCLLRRWAMSVIQRKLPKARNGSIVPANVSRKEA